MVEGDPTRVDRSLTISLGRALEADEYVRVPLYIEAIGHTMLDGSGGECDLSRGSEWTEGIDNLPDWGRVRDRGQHTWSALQRERFVAGALKRL